MTIECINYGVVVVLDKGVAFASFLAVIVGCKCVILLICDVAQKLFFIIFSNLFSSWPLLLLCRLLLPSRTSDQGSKQVAI